MYNSTDQFSSLAVPYVTLGFVVLLIAILFEKTKLPEINEAQTEHIEYTEIEGKTESIAFK